MAEKNGDYAPTLVTCVRGQSVGFSRMTSADAKCAWICFTLGRKNTQTAGVWSLSLGIPVTLKIYLGGSALSNTYIEELLKQVINSASFTGSVFLEILGLLEFSRKPLD